MDSSNSAPARSTLIFALLAGIAAVSTASIFIEFAQNAGAASIVIAAFRLTLATLVLAPLALTRYRAQLLQLTPRAWLLALLSGVVLALHFSVWVTSLQYTSVASSVVLVTTTPLWVAVLSPLVLHERVGKATYVGLVLALLGTMFGYLKIDTATRGYYTRRLQLVSTLAILTTLGLGWKLACNWYSAGFGF